MAPILLGCLENVSELFLFTTTGVARESRSRCGSWASRQDWQAVALSFLNLLWKPLTNTNTKLKTSPSWTSSENLCNIFKRTGKCMKGHVLKICKKYNTIYIFTWLPSRPFLSTTDCLQSSKRLELSTHKIQFVQIMIFWVCFPDLIVGSTAFFFFFARPCKYFLSFLFLWQREVELLQQNIFKEGYNLHGIRALLTSWRVTDKVCPMKNWVVSSLGSEYIRLYIRTVVHLQNMKCYN